MIISKFFVFCYLRYVVISYDVLLINLVVTGKSNYLFVEFTMGHNHEEYQ